jgi:hypothetical protein
MYEGRAGSQVQLMEKSEMKSSVEPDRHAALAWQLLAPAANPCVSS